MMVATFAISTRLPVGGFCQRPVTIGVIS